MLAYQLLAGPWVLNKLGNLWVMGICMITCVFVFFLVPFLNEVSAPGLYVALVVVYALFAGTQTTMAAANAIGLNNSVPRAQLGIANGLSRSAVNLGRFSGPAVFGGLFGWSLSRCEKSVHHN